MDAAGAGRGDGGMKCDFVHGNHGNRSGAQSRVSEPADRGKGK